MSVSLPLHYGNHLASNYYCYDGDLIKDGDGELI